MSVVARPAGAGERWAVVGGGFRGIVAAKLLREAGCTVTLIERMGSLGGILHAVEWQGLYLDKGCHYFDNADDGVTRVVLEILEDRFLPVAPRLATRLNGRVGQGVALLDFSRQDAALRRRLAEELKQAAGAPERGVATLAAALAQRPSVAWPARSSAAAHGCGVGCGRGSCGGRQIFGALATMGLSFRQDQEGKRFGDYQSTSGFPPKYIFFFDF